MDFAMWNLNLVRAPVWAWNTGWKTGKRNYFDWVNDLSIYFINIFLIGKWKIEPLMIEKFIDFEHLKIDKWLYIKSNWIERIDTHTYEYHPLVEF